MTKKIKLTENELTKIISKVINEQSRNTDRVKSTDPVDKDTTPPILKALEKKVDENIDSVAFSIFPSQIEDVMRVADNKLTMPPKSTWFDPKPLDGLVVYEFNQEGTL